MKARIFRTVLALSLACAVFSGCGNSALPAETAGAATPTPDETVSAPQETAPAEKKHDEPAGFDITVQKTRRVYWYEDMTEPDLAFYCVFDCEYPEVTYQNEQYAQQQKKLNDFFAALCESFDFPAQGEGQDGCSYTLADESRSTDLDSSMHSETTVKCTVTQRDEHFCSVNTEIYSYFYGAAHGNYTSQGYVFDVETGNLLALSDIFSNTDDFLSYMADYFYQTYYDEYGRLFGWNTKNLLAGIKPEKGGNWYIRDDCLCVYYEPYLLGSFGDGDQTVSIPLAYCGAYWTKAATRYFDRLTPKNADRN